MSLKKMEKSEQAEENRKRYPLIAEIVDEFRSVFGNGVKVMSGIEFNNKVRKDK